MNPLLTRPLITRLPPLCSALTAPLPAPSQVPEFSEDRVARLAVGETVISLTSPFHPYRNTYERERGVQQNDCLADG